MLASDHVKTWWTRRRLGWISVGLREVAGFRRRSGRFLKIRVSAVRFRRWPFHNTVRLSEIEKRAAHLSGLTVSSMDAKWMPTARDPMHDA